MGVNAGEEEEQMDFIRVPRRYNHLQENLIVVDAQMIYSFIIMKY